MAAFVETVATDPVRAQANLAEALDNTDPERWYDAEMVVVEALRLENLLYFDWRDNAKEIAEDLMDLPGFPEDMTWDWYDWSRIEHWDPDYLANFVPQMADRVAEHGVAVIGVYDAGDAFTLGILPAERLDRFTATAEAANIRIFVYRSGAPMPWSAYAPRAAKGRQRT